MANLKILIVEDEPLYAIEVEQMVDELGYEPIGPIDNGKEVIEHLKQSIPDLILMDISIKGDMDGIELASKINTKNIPIIFLTSHDDREKFEEAKAVGMEAYLTKPFNQFTLQSIIETALAKNENAEESLDEMILKDSVFVKRNNKLQRVKFTEILFIQAEGNYVEIVTESKKYAFKISLRRIKERIPNVNFAQVHRNYLANLEHLSDIDLSANKIQIKEHKLPIGGRFKDDLLNKLNQL